MDFKIDKNGELIIGEEAVILEKEYLRQLARSRIISVRNDWYYDHIGANIEEMFGYFATKETVKLFKEKIINSLTFDGLFDTRNLYIETDINYETLSVTADIHFRNKYTNETDTMSISLDLFNGLLEE